MNYMVRRIQIAAVVGIITLLAHAVDSQALTKNQAMAKARYEQAWDCTWGNFIFYYCSVPLFIVPHCGPTDQNQAGKPQWLCGGIFIRTRKRNLAVQECHTSYWFSPWGKLMYYGPKYKCEPFHPIALRGER